MGFPPLHSSLVPLVFNLTIGKISPQYHVMFDNKFETVASLAVSEAALDETWNGLYMRSGSECYLELENDSTGN